MSLPQKVVFKPVLQGRKKKAKLRSNNSLNFLSFLIVVNMSFRSTCLRSLLAEIVAVNFGSGSGLVHPQTPAFLRSDRPCCAGLPGREHVCGQPQGEASDFWETQWL